MHVHVHASWVRPWQGHRVRDYDDEDDDEDDVRVEWSNSWGLVRSTDLREWEDVSGELSGIPAGARHGTVLPVSARTLRSLEAHTHAFSLLNGDLHEDVL